MPFCQPQARTPSPTGHSFALPLPVPRTHLARTSNTSSVPQHGWSTSRSGHACTAHTLGQALAASPNGDRDGASRGQQQQGWPFEASSVWRVVSHRFNIARLTSTAKVAKD